MKTELLYVDRPFDIARAANLLRLGKLVAMPTETVYGLAADATNHAAVHAIFAAKGRPTDHPLIVHLHDKSALSHWACNIPDDAWQLANAFWPGPLTLLLKKADNVSSLLTGGSDSIGLRVPAHSALLQVLQQYNLAVAAPSANRYKKLSPTSAEQVLNGLNGRIDAVLDGGLCQHGIESTIVDLTSKDIRIVRAGPITASQLAAVLQRDIQQPQQHKVKIAGNVDTHYQPDTTLFCFSTSKLHTMLAETTKRIVVLPYTPMPKIPATCISLTMPDNAVKYGCSLYRALYQADKLGAEAIWCELPPQQEAWLAIHDRLRRASFVA